MYIHIVRVQDILEVEKSPRSNIQEYPINMSPATVFILCCVFIAGCQASLNYTCPRDLSWPYDLITPFPYRTNAPLNIDTSQVKVLNLPVLKHGIAKYEVFTVKNTGHTVAVYTNGPISCTSLSGGPVGNGLYSFSYMNFFWSQNYRGSCCGQIDGETFPLLVAAYYWNVKYGSFQNSIGKRDGLVITYTYVRVEGYIDNPQFAAFGAALKNLTKPGSFTILGSSPPFVWENIFGKVEYYYTYPGAYVDIEHNYVSYDSATIIQFPKSITPCISIPQFKRFTCLLGANGQPLSPGLKSYPSVGRVVVESSCSVSGPLETNIG